jgi:hypothetical protein
VRPCVAAWTSRASRAVSPQVEIRPEIAYYWSLNAPAFDANLSNPNNPSRPTKNYALIGAMDMIWHF